MRWRIVDLEIESGDLVLGTLSNGNAQVTFLTNVSLEGRTAVLWKLYIQGAGPNSMGPWTLIRLAHTFMEALDVGKLHIEGAARTSGAGPGRDPAPILFRRPCSPRAAA